MRARIPVGELVAAIVSCPMRAPALRHVGDAFRRGSLTPRVRRILDRYFAAARRLR